MYPVSDTFLRRIKQSGRRKTVVDVYYDGQQVATGLPVSSGAIRAELDADVRRTGTIAIADPGLVPTFDVTTLSPLGTEVLVKQGLTYPGSAEELVPLGMFRLETTGWNDADGSIPTVQIYDRSKALQVELPTAIGFAGWMAKDALLYILQWIYPTLGLDAGGVFGPDIPNYRIPGGHSFSGGTHYSAISTLASNLGARFFFDVLGAARVELIPDLSPGADPQPVVTLGVGEDGVLMDAEHTHSREGVYNSVTVVGAANTNGITVSATARNTYPGSPTRWDGPFGRVPVTIIDDSLVTGSQCAVRANVELRKYTGASYSIDFSAVPNPAIHEGDVAQFDYLNGTSELHEIASLNIPLGAGTYSGTSKVVVLYG